MSHDSRATAHLLDRRQLLRALAAAPGLASLASWSPAADTELPSGVTFGFGTYGMKSLRVEEAIRVIAEIGYDSIEIAARPDWDSAPDNMPTARRKAARTLLQDHGLRLTAIMEHLFPSADEEEHGASLRRLERVAELAADLSPAAQPLIQTVLGGGVWDEVKAMFRDRLGDWANVGRQTRTVMAIKPHRGGAMSRPEEAAWLMDQLDNTPWIRMVYDYSHYAFRDMPVAQTVQVAMPRVAHVAIKDAVQSDGGVRFLLPGESGQFDYADLIRRLYASGYRGDICCEVSGMVSGQPNYDPLAAARACYANIAPAFIRAEVPRR